MPAAVKIEKTKSMTIAYVEHTGDYGKLPFEEDMKTLYGWAKAKKVRPGLQAMGVFYDMPETTPPERCRSEVAIPIYGPGAPEGGVKVRKLPAMTVAATSHQGPASEYRKTYAALSAWIAEHGYEWSGPAIEVYSKKPEVVRGETILFARIKAPVRKRP